MTAYPLYSYKEYYYAARPGARGFAAGDLTERKKLRQDLKCESFKWYLENVYPEMLPSSDQKIGTIKNKGRVARLVRTRLIIIEIPVNTNTISVPFKAFSIRMLLVNKNSG